MFIKLGNQLFNSDLLFNIRPIDDEHCAVFSAGQSAIDGGFLLNVSAEEVGEELAKTDSGDLLKLADDLQGEIDNQRSKRKGK